jgi:hypothetical protein
VITDFHEAAVAVPAERDVVNVSGIDAIPGGGDNAFTFIGTNPFTAVGQLHYFQDGVNTILEGNLVAGTAPEFQIQVNGLHTFAAGDFNL